MPMLGRFTSTTLSKIEPCVHGVIKVSFVTIKGCNCLEINFPENVFFLLSFDLAVINVIQGL